MVIITIEADRVILEKRLSSPVDASFGLWSHLHLALSISIPCVMSGTNASQSGDLMPEVLLDSDD